MSPQRTCRLSGLGLGLIFPGAIGLALLAGGCSDSPPARPPEASSLNKPGPADSMTLPATHPSAEDAILPGPGDSPAALAARTAAWEKQIEQLRQNQLQHPTTTPAPQVHKPAVAAKAPIATQPAQAGGNSNPILASANIPTGPLNITPPAPPAAPAPAPAVPADALEKKLIATLKDNPKDMVSTLDYQLLHMLRDEPVASPQSPEMAALGAEDRELVSAVLDSLVNFRSAVRADPSMLTSEKIRPLLEMTDRVRAEGDLRIPTLTLASKVSKFADYEPMETHFPAGRESSAYIYCELENFASVLNSDKFWETRLGIDAVLYTETGASVMHWPEKNPITDKARSHRHDFYFVKKITLPGNLPVGKYLLKMTVTDQQANRVAEQTLGITISVD